MPRKPQPPGNPNLKKQALDYAPVAVAVLGQAQRLYLLNDSIDLENPL